MTVFLPNDHSEEPLPLMRLTAVEITVESGHSKVGALASAMRRLPALEISTVCSQQP